MIYIISNIYRNNSVTMVELRNDKLEKIQLKVLTEFKYSIGNFVKVDEINKRPVIDCKVVRPDNYLDYYEKGLKNKELLQEEMKYFVNKIENIDLRVIVDELLLNEEYFLYPAAKTIHHAYIGGLAEHTLSMLSLAQKYVENYNLNISLLYSGIILHDYGKIKELESYGLTYSVEGNLLGHLMIGYEFILSVMHKYSIEENEYTMLLKHMIIAHHGRLEYGSAKEPMTLESYVLSQIDEVDAKINLLQGFLRKAEAGQITMPINGFDKRRFYKMKDEEK